MVELGGRAVSRRSWWSAAALGGLMTGGSGVGGEDRMREH